MKNLLLLFLIGATFTISAQKLNQAIPFHLKGSLISPEEQAMLDYEKRNRPDYLSSEAVKITPGWVNVSQEQVKASGRSLPSNIFSVMYPDTTVKELNTDASLSSIAMSGYGQTINFNNDALSAASDFQFITNKDTVNVQQMRINYLYIRSKTMAAAKSDSIFVSYGVVPRDPRANWVGETGVMSATAQNPKTTRFCFPKAAGSSSEGFQKVFSGNGVAGFKTDTIALVSGTNSSTVNVNKKLIKDSLFIYYVTYKPAEFAPANDTIFDWNNPTRAKYSSFRFSVFSENVLNGKRYFDDQELTTVSGFTDPFTYTSNFFQVPSTRYGLNIGTTKITFYLLDNTNGVNTEFYVSGNTSLSTNEQLAPKFAMAPNPANNTLKINFKEVGQKSIELIDMVGRVINRYTANNANSFSTNDISSLPNGIYFVKITNDLGISATKKLIVSHN